MKNKYPEVINAMFCARCGLPQWDWDPVWEDEGYTVYGKTYCCKGCAQSAHCTCRPFRPLENEDC